MPTVPRRLKERKAEADGSDDDAPNVAGRPPTAVAAPRRSATQSKHATVPAPPPESDDEEFDDDEEFEEEEGSGEEGEEGLDFGDVDDDEEEEDEDDSVHDDEDFETKAAKYKKAILKQSRAAAEELLQDRAREAAPAVLGKKQAAATAATAAAKFGEDGEFAADEDEAAGEDEEGVAQMPLGGMQHSNEELRDRVKEVVRVLSNFKELREEGQTRDEYLRILRADLMELFEYNDFLMDAILEMFPPHEAVQFLEAMEKERPVTIRTNTIKAKRRDLVQALTKKGMHVEPLEGWSKVGLQVFESSVPVSGTVEYLAGHYMVQSAVSFLPVMALAPQEHERVLDMSAAPGGKTTYICSLMKNTGVVFANDVSETRAKALNGNLQRLGCTNVITTNYDGTGFEKIMRNFDRILLDAPCTGTGVISRDKSIKTSKSADDILRMSQLQRRLLISAIDACNANSPTGGYVVYSTCSFMVEEDEAVIDYALRARYVEVVPMGLPFGRPGMTKYRRFRFDPQVAESRRFFPHVHNLDGFFVCKLRKLKDGVKNMKDEGEAMPDDQAVPAQRGDAFNGKREARGKGARRVKSTTEPKPDGPDRVAVPSTAKVSRPPGTTVAAAPRPKREREEPSGTKGAESDAGAKLAPRQPAAAGAASKPVAAGAASKPVAAGAATKPAAPKVPKAKTAAVAKPQRK
jgi:ribosomal RNA methyltransferase Nop2